MRSERCPGCGNLTYGDTCPCDHSLECQCGVCKMAAAKRSGEAQERAARQPCAGWVESPGGWLILRVADGLWCEVPASKDTDADAFVWQVLAEDADGSVILRSGPGTGEAAQLAAEDALLAVRDAITRAVGR